MSDGELSVMEAQNITPTCRANRTPDGAWDEAVRRLREIYDAQVAHDPEVTIALAIFRGDFGERQDALSSLRSANQHLNAMLELAVPEESDRAQLWNDYWRQQLAALVALAARLRGE